MAFFGLFGTPTKVDDLPAINIEKGSDSESRNNSPTRSQTSFTPSMAKQDSIYGSAYQKETDPEALQRYWDHSRKKYEARKADRGKKDFGALEDNLRGPPLRSTDQGKKDSRTQHDNLEVPPQKSDKAKSNATPDHPKQSDLDGSPLKATPYSPLDNPPAAGEFTGQTDEDHINWMEGQIAFLRKKKEEQIRRPQSHISILNQGASATSIDQRIGTLALDQMTMAQAVSQEKVFARLRKSIGTSKAAVTRVLTSIERNKNDRRFLDSSHKKLDEALNNLQNTTDLLLSMQNLMEVEKQMAMDDFYQYEDRVTKAKHFVTVQMSHLDRLTDPNVNPDGQGGVKMKKKAAPSGKGGNGSQDSATKHQSGEDRLNRHPPKSKTTRFTGIPSTDTSISADTKSALEAVRKYEESQKQAGPRRTEQTSADNKSAGETRSRSDHRQVRVNPRVLAQQEADKLRADLRSRSRSQDAREQERQTPKPNQTGYPDPNQGPEFSHGIGSGAGMIGFDTHMPVSAPPMPRHQGPSYSGTPQQVPSQYQQVPNPFPGQFQHQPTSNFTQGPPPFPSQYPRSQTQGPFSPQLYAPPGYHGFQGFHTPQGPYAYQSFSGTPGPFGYQGYMPPKMDPRPNFQHSQHVGNMSFAEPPGSGSGFPTGAVLSTPSYEPPGIVDWRGEWRPYMERPVTKIDKAMFDGSPKTTSWPQWKQNFVAVAGGKHMEDSMKIVILLSMLDGEPLKLLSPFAMEEYNTETYRAMWNALETNYGGLHRQRNTLYKMIERFPVIKKFSKENTMQLENLLTKIMKEFSGETGVMDQGGVLNAQVKKLIPEHELKGYFLDLGKHGKPDTLSNFNEFVRQQRNAYTLADIHLHDDSPKTFFTRSQDDHNPSAPEPNPEDDEDNYQSASHVTVSQHAKLPSWSQRKSEASETSTAPKSDEHAAKLPTDNKSRRQQVCQTLDNKSRDWETLLIVQK
jgi:hypothetical protein